MSEKSNLPGELALLRTTASYCLISLACALLSACAGGAASGVASVATSVVLNAMGVKTEQKPPPPKTISVHVDTANNLNADEQGRGLSAVLRIYKLKDAATFRQASSDKLADAELAKALLGQDLLESQEELLIPGQHYLFEEKVDTQKGYLALAIFFRKPHPERWKLVVANTDLKEDKPIIIGAHACAINVTSGLADKKELADKFFVSSAKCEK
jgi:type VI secretion system protein VasD